MAARRVDDGKLARFVALMNEVYADGYEPGKGAASECGRRGIKEGLLTNHIQCWQWLDRAKERLGIEPDETLYRQPRYQQPSPKLQLLPAAAPTYRPLDGPSRRVLVIPDRHNDPRHPHRLAATTWIARYGSETRPDYVVCLGDSGTWDSCSRHDKNDTLKGRQKPFIKDDLDNMEAAEVAFERGRDKGWLPRKLKAKGNHEQRLWDFENQHPENEGTHTHRYAQTLLQFGWREQRFGEIFYIEGVGFTHSPLVMGRAVGGKTGPLRSANDLCRTLVHGHTHRYHHYDAAKNDPMDKIAVISAGCALPEGEVEHYATHSGATGWRYGVLDLTVQAGEIVDFSWVSMRTLRDRFSDEGGDVQGHFASARAS